jgi:hypothetical protein
MAAITAVTVQVRELHAPGPGGRRGEVTVSNVSTFNVVCAATLPGK